MWFSLFCTQFLRERSNHGYSLSKEFHHLLGPPPQTLLWFTVSGALGCKPMTWHLEFALLTAFLLLVLLDQISASLSRRELRTHPRQVLGEIRLTQHGLLPIQTRENLGPRRAVARRCSVSERRWWPLGIRGSFLEEEGTLELERPNEGSKP